jgi:hypothetical protein
MDIDSLFGQDRFFGLAELPAASSFADAVPVVSLVAGASESLWIDKCLKEMDRVGIDIFPISRYAAAVEGQQMGSQVGDLNPGQNQKSTLIGNQTEVVLPDPYIPSDKSVPGSDVPGGGRPEQTGDRPAMGKGHILEVLSDRLGITQVVVLADEAVTELLLRAPADLLEVDGKQRIDGAMDRCLINRNPVGRLAVGQGIGKLTFGRRQLDPALGFEEQQQAAADHIFEGAIGLSPIPCPAKLLRNEPPAPAGVSGNDPPNKGNIRLIDNPTAICDSGFHDVWQYTSSWNGTQVRIQTFFKKITRLKIAPKPGCHHLLS